MKQDVTFPIAIKKVAESRLGQVDFDHLVFGSVFTDHMFVCDFVNGQWQTPKIVPYGNISMSPAARVFHYGQAVFEGMKAYKDDEGKVWLFRPDENFQRINASSKRMAIPEFPEEYFFEGMKALLNLDKDWIKPGIGNSLYIRPVVFATQPSVMASPSNQYRFMILCSPAQSYYGGEVKVKIAEHYSRAASGGFGYAKAAGNYAGQFYPTELAKEEGFNQIIWTDANEHRYVEEAGTMNVFFRISDTLLTAPVSDRILDGVTRKSVITLAKDLGIAIEERPVEVAEIVNAAKDGSLKEIFGSGTAAVINPVVGFGYKGERFDLPKLEASYASLFKEKILAIQYNRTEDPYGWRYEITD